jgi:transcriptional regulator with GAF, ATPase, and Fis domain
VLRAALTRRGLLILAGILVCVYALAILFYVQTLPDIGIRSAFTPVAKYIYPQYRRHNEGEVPRTKDTLTVVAVGPEKVEAWGDLMWAPIRLREGVESGELEIPELPADGFNSKTIRDRGICRAGGEILVRVQFERKKPGQRGTETLASWFVLGKLPMSEVVPSILWFFLKITLFVIGALVFWKRPNDTAATQFFFLCIITLGAYMGGYHWSHIVTQPALILGFTVCAVLLPVASLHFYLVFPRPKQFLQRYPRWTLLGVYGLPLAFLAALVVGYVLVRLSEGAAQAAFLDNQRTTIYVYMGVAAMWYLASVVSLIHSFVHAAAAAERNQVKWILFGALAALLPISYSFYLAVWNPEEFGGGGAIWPMFGASVCFTVAFAISITQYRLMELDKLLSSGVRYFLISFVAGLVYYAVVFLGTLVFNQVIAGPSLAQALTVSTTALVLMLVLNLARSRFDKAVDRRFSRQKSQLDRTLQRMGQAIEQLVDPPTLAQRLLHASAELLGVPRGAVYLREGEPPIYRLAGNLGPPPRLTELSSGCPLIEVMQSRAALLQSPVAYAPGSPPLASPAQRQLRFLGGELAHALAHEGRLLALLVLGPKDRDAYRSEDLNLLGAFAQITVLALESAVGHRTIEVLNRDLQAKVEKISEQQRRIMALQSQLRRQESGVRSQESGVRGQGSGGMPASALTPDSSGLAPDHGIIGSSLPVRHLLDLVRKVSASDAVVLIRGESGTGKEMLAKALHEHSHRAAKPFVAVHCAALSQGLLESELFGHVKGAYTGAHRDKVGRFELANGGTLFLDEIGDINLEIQTKLLRAVQEMTFERVGSSDPVQVNVRIIAATHQNLEELIQQGRFREDLYFRLNVISIPVPPLRERREDIPELALHFLRLLCQRAGKAVAHIDDDALAVLKSYPWPGNIRQLENAIARAVVVAEDAVVTVQDLPEEIVEAVDEKDLWSRPAQANGDSVGTPDGLRAEREQYDRHERERLVRALATAGGNKAKAARALGLARSTLVSRLKKHGLS